jgi:hypothetical protein
VPDSRRDFKPVVVRERFQEYLRWARPGRELELTVLTQLG